MTDPSAMYALLRDGESDRMVFEIDRDPEPGRTVSADAFDETMMAIRTFVAARLARHVRPEGTRHVGIEVRVEIDGESLIADRVATPWYRIDGERRTTGETP